MPEKASLPNARVSGEDILTEILRNMEEGLFRIRKTALVPSVYRVYIHPEEFEPLRGAVSFLTEEIRKALDEQLEKWNQTSKPLSLLKRLGGNVEDQVEYRKMAGDWTIELLPDADGSLQRGEIEIHSELGAQEKKEYGSGELTRRIFKSPPAAPEPAFSSQAETERTGPVNATIRYEDNAGPHNFEMKRTEIVVGRGGKAYWVDLKLDTLPDVSREHCRIRRDPGGEFFLKDTSQFGTSIDGKPAPKDQETALPRKCRISLAEIVFLDFEGK